MTTSITLPKWFDLHTHLRQEELLAHTITDHLKAGCAGVLAMPNTKPPLLNIDDVEQYVQTIKANGGDKFEHIIVPLYLSAHTTPDMIEQGAKSGTLKACKYYPPHGTTGAEFSADMQTLIEHGVLNAMAEHNIILCIHGEMHDLSPETYFAKNTNAEEIFYQSVMPHIRAKFPDLKIVCEHITTKVAVDFVNAHPSNTAATITPQHLIYTIGDLVKGLKYHLYCLPLLKFEQDREALREAATTNNTQFFAGTDSAPHTHKATDCGCAAGCYTAPIGPQLYAQAFELSGVDLSTPESQALFKTFLCDLGAEFYNLPQSEETFTLEKSDQAIEPTLIEPWTLTDAPHHQGDNLTHDKLIPLPLGLNINSLPWRIK